MGQKQVAEKSRSSFQTKLNKEELKKELKEGYSKMADLNLELAREGLLAEQEAYQQV